MILNEILRSGHCPDLGGSTVLGNIKSKLSSNILVYGFVYSGVRVIASRILHEICLLIGRLAIRGTKLTLNVCLGTKSYLLIEQYC